MARSFAVLGMGTFGFQMAVHLQEDGGEVLAVDMNDSAVQQISPYVTRAAVADLTDEEALRNLGVHEVEAACLGLPDHFDVAVLVTHFLKNEGVERILVQVETQSQASAIKAVGATDVIFPEADYAARLARQLLVPESADQIQLYEDTAVVELDCPKKWVGKSLIDLDIRKKFDVYVIGFRRPTGKKKGEEEQEFTTEIIPSPDEPLEGDERLLVLGKSKSLTDLQKKFNGEE